MGVKEQIKKYADYRGFSESTVGTMCGMSRSGFSSSKNLSSESVSTFLTKNQELSAEWVMRGTGGMLLSSCDGARVQNVVGDNNTSVNGNWSTTAHKAEESKKEKDVDEGQRFIDMLMMKDEQLTRCEQTIERLVAIIDQLSVRIPSVKE